MIGWIIAGIILIISMILLHGTGIALRRIAKEMHRLCLKANEDPETVLKRQGLIQWLE
ncbi:MAG TPA: hypothetical protein H9887_05440 [Candidatus Dorea intestinavium]|jgi:hypothetical protein|nr:hypothetical protein [Candidatus Dorea intestinavium]